MRGNRGLHVLKVLLIVVVAFTVFGVATMLLWNWLMPTIFGLRAITFGQAVGMVALSKILLGGFRPPWAGRGRWKRDMAERWTEMSPEEREQLRAGMRGRWGCGFGRNRDTAAEQKPAI